MGFLKLCLGISLFSAHGALWMYDETFKILDIYKLFLAIFLCRAAATGTDSSASSAQAEYFKIPSLAELVYGVRFYFRLYIFFLLFISGVILFHIYLLSY
jgi:hypothetical protein